MKNNIIFLLLLAFLSLYCVPGETAGQLDYTSYYPSPTFSFSSLRLYPQPEIAALGEPCGYPGKLYFNEDQSTLFICQPLFSNPSQNQWSLISTSWTQSGDAMYPSDTTNPSDKHVGIGTETPLCKLTIDGPDSGILAQGTEGSGAILARSFPAGSTQFLWYPRKGALVVGSMGDQTTIDSDNDNSNGIQPRVTRGDSQIGLYSAAFGEATFAAAPYSYILAGSYCGVDATSDYTTILTQAMNPARDLSAAFGLPEVNTLYADSKYSVFSSLMEVDPSLRTYGSDYSFVAMGSVLQDSDYTVAFGYNTRAIRKNGVTGSLDHLSFGNCPSPTEACEIRIETAGADASYSTMFSSSGAIVESDHSFIGNGTGNYIRRGSFNTLFNGKDNTIGADLSGSGPSGAVLISGENNTIGQASFSLIGGGQNNTLEAPYAIILGGSGNTLGGNEVGPYPIIAGGKNNENYSEYSFIGGGEGNTIGSVAGTSGQYSVIGGGENNTILGDDAFIGSGQNNTINTGGDYSVIPNGRNVTINGSYSWAMGNNITVSGNNDFVWGYKDNDSTAATGPLTINDSDVFIIYHYYNNGAPTATAPELPVEKARFGIQTTNPQYTMDVNGSAAANTLIISNPPGISGSNMYWDTSTGQIGLDLAELFASAETVEPGDVLVIAPSGPDETLVEKSRTAYDKKVVGIVSTAPGMVFEGDRIVSDFKTTGSTQKPPVALAGRVPCKVTLENGPIRAGDLLTTSSTPGHAMKADRNKQAFGTILGKALKSFGQKNDKADKAGVIPVFVGLQ